MTREEVKALIAEKIKSNGEGAITAEVLAEVLSAINEEGVLDASQFKNGDEISKDFADKMSQAKEIIHNDLSYNRGLKITFLSEEEVANLIASGRGTTGLSDGEIHCNTAFGFVCGEGTSKEVVYVFKDFNGGHFYLCFAVI